MGFFMPQTPTSPTTLTLGHQRLSAKWLAWPRDALLFNHVSHESSGGTFVCWFSESLMFAHKISSMFLQNTTTCGFHLADQCQSPTQFDPRLESTMASPRHNRQFWHLYHLKQTECLAEAVLLQEQQKFHLQPSPCCPLSPCCMSLALLWFQNQYLYPEIFGHCSGQCL